MCAILDANVAGQVFGTGRPPAGAKFFEWIDSGRGRLVIGGRLRRELESAQCVQRVASSGGPGRARHAVERRGGRRQGDGTRAGERPPLGRRARRRCSATRRGASAVHERRGPAGGFQGQGSGRRSAGQGLHDASSRRLDTGPSPPAGGPHLVCEPGAMTAARSERGGHPRGLEEFGVSSSARRVSSARPIHVHRASGEGSARAARPFDRRRLESGSPIVVLCSTWRP